MGRRQVVVITGASAGLGRAIAQRFAEDGACIGLIARGRERLEAARRDVVYRGGRARTYAIDVADPDAVEDAAERVEDAFGPIDVWINNAMTSVFSPVREMEPDDYRRVTDVTYLGYVHGTLSALRRMLPRDRGVIIQVGSSLAHRGIPLQSAYCAAKHAVKGFTESLLVELAHDRSNVRVTMVQMPAMNTPQFDWAKSRLPRRLKPMGVIFQPEVGAEAVHYAAHHDCCRELLVTGSTLKLVFGEKLVPRYIDRRLAREGYDGQQADEPRRANGDGNLWAPVAGLQGAHGRFDDRARGFSAELWARTHRRSLVVAGGAVAGVLLGVLGPRLARR
jgi:NAD(P)-dependent dehydrogenase (short-subunit alcohol dehydrogenase family)